MKFKIENKFQNTIKHVLLLLFRLKTIVFQVVNPGSFWATQKDVITKKQGRDLFKWLNSPKANLEVFLTLPEVGTMCAAPYQVENNFWFYRARIDKLYTDTDQNLAKVKSKLMYTLLSKFFLVNG